MIHGYHVVLPVYGFWLPNDPRGAWSDFVWRWELVRFGRSTRSCERRSFDQLSPTELATREAAREALKYPAVTLTGQQAQGVGKGFAKQSATSRYTIWACSILPEHTHLVIARHTYGVERIVNLLKGAATRQLVKTGCHPLARQATPGERPPRMWAAHEWKVYLDSEEAIEAAIEYVEENPAQEDKPRQHWSFVKPFAGLPKGGWTTYY